MPSTYRCPKCGCQRFITVAVSCPELDENLDLIKTGKANIDWSGGLGCAECAFSGPTSEFLEVNKKRVYRVTVCEQVTQSRDFEVEAYSPDEACEAAEEAACHYEGSWYLTHVERWGEDPRPKEE